MFLLFDVSPQLLLTNDHKSLQCLPVSKGIKSFDNPITFSMLSSGVVKGHRNTLTKKKKKKIEAKIMFKSLNKNDQNS